MFNTENTAVTTSNSRLDHKITWELKYNTSLKAVLKALALGKLSLYILLAKLT